MKLRSLFTMAFLLILPNLHAEGEHISLNPKHYLIAEDSHVKLVLDRLLTGTDALKNQKSFDKAGFVTLCFRSKGSLRVAKHPELPGLLLKVYLDDTSIAKNYKYKCLARRAAIATEVRKLIQKHNMKHITVPGKWLYEIPTQQPAEAQAKKRYLLVVEDMQLVKRKKSDRAWKKEITPAILREVYHILKAGYTSLAVSQNIPYTKKKTFSCIDTEYAKREFDLLKINKFLSPKMRRAWKKIVEEHKNSAVQN